MFLGSAMVCRGARLHVEALSLRRSPHTVIYSLPPALFNVEATEPSTFKALYRALGALLSVTTKFLAHGPFTLKYDE